MEAKIIAMPVLDVVNEPPGLPLLGWVLVIVAAGGLAGLMLLFRSRRKNR
jgi:hypothetical protein